MKCLASQRTRCKRLPTTAGTRCLIGSLESYRRNGLTDYFVITERPVCGAGRQIARPRVKGRAADHNGPIRRATGNDRDRHLPNNGRLGPYPQSRVNYGQVIGVDKVGLIGRRQLV
jgi:hypothetical protein